MSSKNVPSPKPEKRDRTSADANDIQMKRLASNAADQAALSRTYKTKELAMRTELTVKRDEHIEPLSRENATSWPV